VKQECASKQTAPGHYVAGLAISNLTARNYRKALNDFQRFVASQNDDLVSLETLRQWLRDRSRVWPFDKLAGRARLVDRFLTWMASQHDLQENPFAKLKTEYEQRTTAPLVRALLSPDFRDALEALRPIPPFGSFLGSVMRDHLALMKSLGYRYDTQESRLLRFDRFLQSRPDLNGRSLNVLVREWANTRSGPQQALDCHLAGRTLSEALSRIDRGGEAIPWDKRIKQAAHQGHRRPYIFSEQEVTCLLNTALSLPSTQSRLRPRTAHMMLVLAYCAGLRIGEIARLNVGHFDAGDRTITVRGTKFFKTRCLPLSDTVVAALSSYFDARKSSGAPAGDDSPLFWHERATASYSPGHARSLLVSVMRRAGLKTARGRTGPRVHDLRHAFVVNRMIAWYREGINPQSRLPYLATYLGHKDINSTLVYLTATQELLQEASARFRSQGAVVLGTSTEGARA
jgi:site-specific recombinase XerD